MTGRENQEGQDARRGGKSANAFRTISEVSLEIDVPQHVLRFWESKFPQVRPLKRGGGRRYYRPEDMALLRRIRRLLYEDGYTIKGVQKVLREGDVDREGIVEALSEPQADLLTPLVSGGAPDGTCAFPLRSRVGDALPPAKREALQGVLAELIALRDVLKGASRDEAVPPKDCGETEETVAVPRLALGGC